MHVQRRSENNYWKLALSSPSLVGYLVSEVLRHTLDWLSHEWLTHFLVSVSYLSVGMLELYHIWLMWVLGLTQVIRLLWLLPPETSQPCFYFKIHDYLGI